MYSPIHFKSRMLTHNSLIRSSPLRRGLPRKQQLPRTQAMWIIRGFLLIPLALAWFALSPTARAVSPAPDGGYANNNTAEGEDALFSLTSGAGNTANGAFALFSNTTGSNNTATGFDALLFNTTGISNTATGSAALSAKAIFIIQKEHIIEPGCLQIPR